MGNVFYVYNDIAAYTIDAAFMGGPNAMDVGTEVSITLYEMDPLATSVADVFIPVFSGANNGISYEVCTQMIVTRKAFVSHLLFLSFLNLIFV